MGTYPENGYYFYGRLWLLRLFRILKSLVILNPPPFFACGAIRITRLVVVFLWCRAKFRHRRRQNIVYLVGGLSFKKFYKSRRGLLFFRDPFVNGAKRITRLVVVFLRCRAKFRHRRRQNIVYLVGTVGGLSFKKF